MTGELRPCAILAYHEVMPESGYSYCVTCSQLRLHLRMLRSRLPGSADSSPVEITFDDGEESQYTNGLPLLTEHGISATFFVSPGLIGTAAKFLGWEQLKHLQAAGHSIQSHGWSHKFLTVCGRDELAHELRASKESLEDHLGRRVESISAPGGRWNQTVGQACAAAGYKRLYVSEPWISGETHGVKVLGRYMVRRTTTPAELKRVLLHDRRWLERLRLRAQIKKRLVGVIGDAVYHRLWCRFTGYLAFEEERQSNYSEVYPQR